jgi:hypothetical protein
VGPFWSYRSVVCLNMGRTNCVSCG